MSHIKLHTFLDGPLPLLPCTRIFPAIRQPVSQTPVSVPATSRHEVVTLIGVETSIAHH